MQQEHSTILIEQPETTDVAKPQTIENLNQAPKRSVPHKRRARKILAIIGALVLITSAATWWWHARHYEETDDAQVDGNIYPISARISGHLAAVNVQEGQFVKAGMLLVEIDSKDYEIAVERAKAEYLDAVAQARAAGLDVPVSQVGSTSQITAAEAEFDRAEAGVTVALKGVEEAQAKLIDARSAATTANSDVQRYTQLVAKREISQQQYDDAKAAADAANARVSGAEAAVRSAEEQVRQARAHLRQSTANLESAR